MKHASRPLRSLVSLLSVLLLLCLAAVGVTAAEPTETVALSSYSVTLGEDIGLRVYVSAEDGAQVSVAFTYRGTRTVVTEATEADGLLSYAFHGVTPQYLAEPITVEVIEQGTVIEARTVSVADYCKTLCADGTRATAEALLLYGAAAEQYVGLADSVELSGLPSAEDVTALPLEHPAAADDAAFRLCRLGLALANNVCVYLDVEATGEDTQPPQSTVFVGNTGTREASVEAQGTGRWRICFPLKASELYDTSVTVSVQGASGGTDTVTFGATTYLQILAEGEDAALSALARAIFGYARMAEDYVSGHSYELLGQSTATCGADGLLVSRCTVCADVKSTVTPANETHEHMETEVRDGKAVLYCTDCGESFAAEVSAYALGDVMSDNFRGACATFDGGTEQLPTAQETGNVYYSFTRAASGSAQAQLYANDAGTTENVATRRGFLSFKLRAPDQPLDGIWTFQLMNNKGTWSAHSTVNAKGFTVIAGNPAGEVYATSAAKSNTATLATLKKNVWTRFDILFASSGNNIVLTYYVDGQRVFEQTLENTLCARTVCGVYFTTTASTVGATFCFDDVIFGYADTARDGFLGGEHTFERVSRIAPTCYEEGYEELYCSHCETTRLSYLAPAHVMQTVSLTEASCLTDGVIEEVCRECGTVGTRALPAIGSHSYGAWTTVTAPTAMAEGLQQRACSVCGDVEDKTMLRLTASNIHTLYLTGEWESASKTNDVTVQVAYVPTEGEGFSCYGTIHWQGASSLGYPEKNYTLKLYKDETLAKKNKVDLGWGKESKYCLKANWVDCTSARNVVACRLWGDIVDTRTPSALQARLAGLPTNAGAIDGFPVAVYMNGEFHGLYTLNVPKDEWMLGMDDVETEAILMANDWNNSTFRTTVGTFALDSYGDWVANGGAWELKYFGTEKTTGSPQWVTDSFNDLILFCQTTQNDGAAFRAGIDRYLDMDATIDYLIYFYAIYMRDNSAKNILWATYDGKVWFPSIYDQDGTFGMAWDGIREAPPTGQLPTILADGTVEDGIYDHDSLILWNIILNEYSTEILDRYYELRETVLTEEHMETVMAEFLAEIPADVLTADRAKWNKPGVGKFEWDYIESWIPARLAAMDEAFGAIADTVGYEK